MTNHPRRKPTLDDLYTEYGLIRPTQFKKHVPPHARDHWESVEFDWGKGTVIGWRSIGADA